MRLRNGSDEEQAVINAVWLSLKDLKADHGNGGLLIARRYALGITKNGVLLKEYGLVTSGGMSQSAKNIILSAVTTDGALVNPVQR